MPEAGRGVGASSHSGWLAGQLEARIAKHQREMRLDRCLAIDLEVSRERRQIYDLAAVRPDTHESLRIRGVGGVRKEQERLDALTVGAEFVIGHNLIDFDLAHLRNASPRLRLLKLPAADTGGPPPTVNNLHGPYS